jgi:hypothetical protein
LRDAAPFDVRGQNVNRTNAGGRSATERKRNGNKAKGQQSHGEADGRTIPQSVETTTEERFETTPFGI